MTVSHLRLVGAVLVALAVMAYVGLARAQLLSPGPLSKGHSSLEGDDHCSACHSSGKRVDQSGCLKCHGDLGARIAAGKGLHGLQYGAKACESCHAEHLGGGTSIHWPGGDPSKLDHALTGWRLEGAPSEGELQQVPRQDELPWQPHILSSLDRVYVMP